MSESIKKEDLREILRTLKAEEMGHNNYYNVPPYPPHKEVSNVINSALFWIGALATVLTFVGILIYSIYSGDSQNKDQRINSNTLAITSIQKTQTETNNLVIEMQGNQERITQQIDKNARTLEDINRQYNDMRLSRFSDKDGKALDTELSEKVRAVQSEFIRENIEIKNELRGFERSIEDFRNLKDRINALENKTGVR